MIVDKTVSLSRRSLSVRGLPGKQQQQIARKKSEFFCHLSPLITIGTTTTKTTTTIIQVAGDQRDPTTRFHFKISGDKQISSWTRENTTPTSHFFVFGSIGLVVTVAALMA
jgi:folylpolyglutamate synthase/dihydropteroate synthase